MLLFSFLCSLLIGWALGGLLSRFDRAGLEWLFLPAAALLFRLAFEKVYTIPYSSVLLFGSYLLLFLFSGTTAICLSPPSVSALAVYATWWSSQPTVLRCLCPKRRCKPSPPGARPRFCPARSPCTGWPIHPPAFSFLAISSGFPSLFSGDSPASGTSYWPSESSS